MKLCFMHYFFYDQWFNSKKLKSIVYARFRSGESSMYVLLESNTTLQKLNGKGYINEGNDRDEKQNFAVHFRKSEKYLCSLAREGEF